MTEKFYAISDQSIIENLNILNNNIKHYINIGELMIFYNPLDKYGRKYISRNFSQKQIILINNHIKILDQANNIYFEKKFMAENPFRNDTDYDAEFLEDLYLEDNFSITSEDSIFYHNIDTTYDK